MKHDLGYVLEKYPEVPKFYPGVHTQRSGAGYSGTRG